MGFHTLEPIDSLDPDLLKFLLGIPAEAGYMLGDAVPPFSEHARYYAARLEGRITAAMQVYAPPEFGAPAIQAAGDPWAASLLIRRWAERPRSYMMFSDEVRPAVEEMYQMDAPLKFRRMTLDPRGRGCPDQEGIRLVSEDYDEFRDFLKVCFNGEYFLTPDMLCPGRAAAIYQNDVVTACACTHALAKTLGVAFIGNVAAAPDRRHQGLGRRVMLHLLYMLEKEGVTFAALNVLHDNLPAVRLYESLGFEHAGIYWAGPGDWRGDRQGA